MKNKLKQKGRGGGNYRLHYTDKDKEINELKIKIASLETRAASAEQENDSLKSALNCIMQEKSEGERQMQKNQNFVEIVSQGKPKSETERQRHKTKLNRKERENIQRNNITLHKRFQPLENTVYTTRDVNDSEDGEYDNPSRTTIMAEWKLARVSPILKKGKTDDPNNYRPISIIPTVAKIFEKILYDQLCEYLNDNNLLTHCQSGFRLLHSTLTALIEPTNCWSVNIGLLMV